MKNMSRRSFRWFMIALLIIVVLLFVFAYFVGSNEGEKSEDDSETVESSSLNSSNEQDSKDEENNQDENHNHEPHEDFDPDKHIVSEDEGENNQLKDYFSDSEIERAYERGIHYVTAFHEFNGEKPKQHIKNISDHVSDDFYEQLSSGLTRPSEERFYVNVTDTNIQELVDIPENIMAFIVKVNADIHDINDNKVDEEIVEYTLYLQKHDDEFLIETQEYNRLNRE